jgi:hypothetical protein
MRKSGNMLKDHVVNAFDRASQAQYQLQDLIERVEEAILQEKEAIRAACPQAGGSTAMARTLLHYLQQEPDHAQGWTRVALGTVLALIDMKRLVGLIWPELKRSAKKAPVR